MADSGSLRAALLDNTLIPTSSWEPRCHLCRLARSNPDAYEWCTDQLLDGMLTQDQIAAEMLARYNVTTTQGRLSEHKTKHLDPALRDARETFIGHRVMLDFCRDMEPGQMAVVYAQLAIMKLYDKLETHEGELPLEAKDAAGIGSALAALSKALQSGAKLPVDLEVAALAAETAKLKAEIARGDHQEAFAAWVEQNYPELVPHLAHKHASQMRFGGNAPGAAEAREEA
jgi:hypothetical protein